MKQWLVFRDKESGRELAAYTLQGTFEGERQATIELLAYENKMEPEQIETVIEQR